MLERSLIEHAFGALYGDKHLADSLWKYLHVTDPLWELQEPDSQAFLEQFARAVDDRNPRRYRLNEVSAICQLKQAPWLYTELPWLDVIFENLMQRNGDFVHYKESQVQAYARLAAELDPTLLVGWHLSRWLSDSTLQAHDIKRVFTAQNLFFAPPASPHKPYADGHVHLGGVGGGVQLLEVFLLEREAARVQDFLNAPELKSYQSTLTRVRKLFYALIDKLSQETKIGIETKTLRECLCNSSNPMLSYVPDWKLLEQNCLDSHIFLTGSPAWLIGQFSKSIHTGFPCWLWLFTALCQHYRTTKDEQDRIAILCWFQLVNHIHSSTVMDGQGLTRFAQDYFSHPIRKRGKAKVNKISTLFAGKNDCAEIKVAPGAFNPGTTIDFTDQLLAHNGIKTPQAPYVFGEHESDPKQHVRYLEQLERWHLCGHFSRSYGQRYPEQKKCTALWKEARKLMKQLDVQSGWALPQFLGGNKNPNFCFQPGRWFRGLDVAGDENALQIEWFAPILRWLRRGFLSRPEGEQPSRGFHFSIHAGEDYAHPVSGLRHIDETVRFCEMTEGDRLGHALALGIEPAEWAARQGQMIISLDEHLDNLVWLWHYATELSSCLSLAAQCVPRLERRITYFSAEYSEVLGGTKSPIAPAVLFEAWKLRRNCRYTQRSFSNGIACTEKEHIAVPDHKRLLIQKSDKKKCSSAECAVQQYLLRHRYFERHSLESKEMPKVLISKTNSGSFEARSFSRQEGFFSDCDTNEELLFMTAVQDYLLSEYDSRGLIIEANPTSNVYIARLTCHREHPIFRWSPPDESLLELDARYNRFGLRKGPVRVLVNTDDPGIMPTTLRTEFLLLREAAMELGVGRTVIERWLEELRSYGIEQFQRNHLQVFNLD